MFERLALSAMTSVTRVLTVVESLGVGGTERAAEQFAIGYAKSGLDSRLWAVESGGPRHASLTAAGVQVVLEGGISDLLRAWTPHIVHLHSNGLAIKSVELVRRMASHAAFVEQCVFSRPTPWSSELLVSYQLSEACLSRYARYPQRAPTAIVPNPVDTSAFFRDEKASKELRTALRIPQGAFVAGRVGQPSTYKWSPLTLRAFDQLADKDPKAYLVLLGAPQEIKWSLKRSKHRDRVRILPAISNDTDLRSVYSMMDVFVHASAQGESFGYVLCEAMLCEVPVVTIDTPWADNSQREIVGPGGLVSTKPSEFLKALNEIARNPQRRKSMGRAGRESVIERFDSSVVCAQSVAVISLGSDANAIQGGTWPHVWYSRINYRIQSKWRLGTLEWLLPKVLSTVQARLHSAKSRLMRF